MDKNSPYYNIYPDLPVEVRLEYANLLLESVGRPTITMREFLKIKPLPVATPKSTKGDK